MHSYDLLSLLIFFDHKQNYLQTFIQLFTKLQIF